MNEIVTTPVFLLFVGVTFLLTLGYFWGRRRNQKVFLDAFNDLVGVVKPDDQTFTNIGGVVGYHANLYIKNKSPVTRVDATITLLPRHSWLYLPVSYLIMRYDRLFITFYVKPRMPGEGHLIETGYARFRGPKITNEQRLNRETVQWGTHDFHLYYESIKVRDHFIKFVSSNPDPGIIRHIAFIPEQKKGFVFMLPRRGMVARYFQPIYQWIPSFLARESGKS